MQHLTTPVRTDSRKFTILFRLVTIEVGTSALLTTLVRTDSRKFTMLFRLVRIEVGTILFRLVTTEVRTIFTIFFRLVRIEIGESHHLFYSSEIWSHVNCNISLHLSESKSVKVTTSFTVRRFGVTSIATSHYTCRNRNRGNCNTS